MRILGLHEAHNAAVCLLENGVIVSAIQEARLTRLKNQEGFPFRAISEILAKNRYSLSDIDFIAMNGNHMSYPRTQDELKEDFRKSSYLWTSIRKLVRKTPIRFIFCNVRKEDRLKNIDRLPFPREKVIFVDHHTVSADGRCDALSPYIFIKMII